MMDARASVDLAAFRLVDWRFALPDQAAGTVAFIGAPPVAEVDALGASGALVEVMATVAAAGGRRFDTVVLTEPEASAAAAAAQLVNPGGWIVAHVTTGLRRQGARWAVDLAPLWQRRLRAVGLESVRALWHAPNRNVCSYIVPLAEASSVRFVLKRWRGIRFGRLKSLAARTLL